MAALKQSERLFALMARRAQELGGRRLKRDEWLEVADRFFADLSKERARATTHPDAEAIYAAYPRKVGKEEALRAITAAIARKGGECAGILDACAAYGKAVATWPRAVRYKRGDTGDTFDTVPHPATWFNAGRYDDDRANWPSYGAASKAAPAPDEPEGWRDFLRENMPTAEYLKPEWTWGKIDQDIRAHILSKMKAV